MNTTRTLPTPDHKNGFPLNLTTDRWKKLKAEGGIMVNCELRDKHAAIVSELAKYYGQNTKVIRALIEYAGEDLLQQIQAMEE